ncbi:hypothetical protein [Streptomyces sp. UG1]|uniref:hypothetical protein n=1 Tax=Streptomyces sp. UG1 TaxID=3417652 RepID=UPI003CE9854B
MTMSQESEVAAFTIDCPAGETGVGSVTMAPGVVRPGSFVIGVDTSADTIRWALTVTQPESQAGRVGRPGRFMGPTGLTSPRGPTA